MSPAEYAHGQNRQFLIKQAGKMIGTADINMIKGQDAVSLTTQVRYPNLEVEFQTIIHFSGADFPKKPVSTSSP